MTEPAFPGGTVVQEGEFAGWSYWEGDPYETRSGPFFTKKQDDGSFLSAFRAQDRHMNGAGFMHGGCLLTFADFALFSIATKELDGQHGVTMNLSGDFLDAGQNGQLIEARGEVTRAGGRTIYVRGIITSDGKPVLSFTGIIAKIRKKG